MPTLVREPAVVEAKPEPNADDIAFAKECCDRLGYHTLLSTLKGENPHILAEALKKLDIQPFSDKSVAKYKRRKRITEGFKHPVTFFFTLGIVSILSWMIGGPITSLICWYYGCTLFGLCAGWYALITAVTGFIALIVFVNCTENVNAYDIRWRKISLDEYSKPIPEFALQTALDLKKACGDKVSFFIDELEVIKRKRDPFLVAKDRSTWEEFYIEVWNEAKFGKK
ncbi:MAG: hypothetical protein M0R80_25715 [Proteobacteria bacterium]|jgi:hypothetical protein|nr:hypothetical protein [Pseudomonadota bacterium]